jgi:outer membrane beta-barrel protein
MNMTIQKRLLLLATLLVHTTAWSLENVESDVETVYVVQPKPMQLSNRFELGVLGAYDLADRYITQAGISAQAVYHVSENFAVAVQGTYFFWQGDSSITQNLNGLRDANNQPVITPNGANILFVAPYARYFRKPWIVTSEIQWSPLFGKLSFHDFTFGLFQLYVTAGLGVSGVSVRDLLNNNVDVPLPSTINFATSIGAGVRMYFGEHFGLKIEVRDIIEPMVARSNLNFKVPAPSSFYISHSPVLQAGLSYVF